MNTLKPMLTVVLLAGIGVVLYFKINQTPPVLPEGASDEFLEAPTLDFVGVDDEESDPSVSAPAFEPQRPTSLAEAPSFTGGGDASAEAPMWTPPATTEPDFGNRSAPSASDAPAAAEVSAEIPPLPELPPPPESSISSNNDYAAAGAASRSVMPAQSTSADPFANPPPPIATSSNPNAPEPPFDKSISATTPPSGPASQPASPPPFGQAMPPIVTTPVTSSTSTFAVARVVIDESLRRGELSEALRLLTDYYDDPSLNLDEKQEVETLLSQLAGTVIYSTAHKLEPPHVVQSGETLAAIAARYNVSAELLAKINGLANPDGLAPGSQLKVVPGPFTGVVDLARNELRLILNGRYAGKFPLAAPPMPEQSLGTWTVQSKAPAANAGGKLVLQSDGTSATPLVIEPQAPTAGGPQSVQLSAGDLQEVYDILTVGSKIIVRR